MTTEGKLTELLDAATADVPAHHLEPPLALIHGRGRRRRRTLAVATAAVTAAVVAGGFSVGQRLLAEPAPRPAGPAATVSPTATPPPALPWVFAMVSRDDKTITVYAAARRCEQLSEPRARLTEQGADRVSIEVTARVVPAADCTTSGNPVPISVTLDKPLEYRRVLDALRGPTRPLYFERDLPDLRADNRWSPVGEESWQHDDPALYRKYVGPGGATLVLRAGTPKSDPGDRGGPYRMSLGLYGDVTITRNDAGAYRVWWHSFSHSGTSTYSLQIVPAEGESITLTQFKREVNRLTWR